MAGQCSNPCRQNDEVDVDAGTRVQKCRWDESGSCSDKSENCYGEKQWTFTSEGDNDHSRCIHRRREFEVINKAPEEVVVQSEEEESEEKPAEEEKEVEVEEEDNEEQEEEEKTVSEEK